MEVLYSVHERCIVFLTLELMENVLYVEEICYFDAALLPRHTIKYRNKPVIIFFLIGKNVRTQVIAVSFIVVTIIIDIKTSYFVFGGAELK